MEPLKRKLNRVDKANVMAGSAENRHLSFASSFSLLSLSCCLIPSALVQKGD